MITGTVSARAADTGSVSGAVFDQNGEPVADATVKISGTTLPLGRTVQTGANGLFQFQYLVSGENVRLPLDIRANVTLEARLLNVFNNQTRLSTDSQQYLDLQTLPTAPYFAPYQQLNPFFATGNGFAPPRRLHVAAALSF